MTKLKMAGMAAVALMLLAAMPGNASVFERADHNQVTAPVTYDGIVPAGANNSPQATLFNMIDQGPFVISPSPTNILGESFGVVVGAVYLPTAYVITNAVECANGAYIPAGYNFLVPIGGGCQGPGTQLGNIPIPADTVDCIPDPPTVVCVGGVDCDANPLTLPVCNPHPTLPPCAMTYSFVSPLWLLSGDMTQAQAGFWTGNVERWEADGGALVGPDLPSFVSPYSFETNMDLGAGCSIQHWDAVNAAGVTTVTALNPPYTLVPTDPENQSRLADRTHYGNNGGILT